ncbi:MULTISPECIES: acyl-[acyl-carrier-protein] thioesterase [unclassified Capnocytophaga]|jgi:Acyl-ACP thioesterase|uniref:acyl-[acyl-carrier-protein] thioesterase n=1 Tax=unclassified Capnocytophaga TaxID=2640652 RepID=UPI000202E493|nr:MULTISPECIES: acyl-ACP thioesterase domain-containing protein [unclassified Capnocytophaga]EGD34946.1 acyl-ACP thioesterase superfamily protein [Capnocytophaga sp. oral taxon 338 str. F0234]MEB3004062.1 acyl-ACP thioesterase domain-containing protein [Capnocytophaga sp. G2]
MIIFTETYKVRSTQVNLNNQLGLYGVLGMLQDIAAEHASVLGFGYKDLVAKGFFWALIQQKLKMDYWPQWNEKVTIHTWSLPLKGIHAFREFELYVGERKIGQCASTWITLDIHSRKPIDMTEKKEIFMPREEGGLSFHTDKVLLPQGMYQVNDFRVRISDLDVNSHVNNVKYTQWALDMMRERDHREWVIKEYDINFLSETFLGDNMQGFKSKGRYLNAEKTLVETFLYAQKEGGQKPAFIAKWIAERIIK